MSIKSPLIDPRKQEEIAEQTRKLLCHYLSGPPYNWQRSNDGGEIGQALTNIFAHYCGLVVDRLNRAPEKNFLAFLDLLGNALVPPRPAQVPVTFFLDARAAEGISVPAGTRMRADPGEGGKDPIPFEMSRDLWLTTLVLTGLKRGTTDLSLLINKESAELQEKIFAQAVPYSFELTLPAGRALPVGRPVTLFFFIDNPVYDPAESRGPIQPLVWEYEGTNAWEPLFVEDETQSLTQTGTVEFLVPSDLSLSSERRAKIQGRLKDDKPYNPPPLLQWVALNTVTAMQVVSVRDEVLGSSNGNPNQRFTTFRKPVLPDQQIHVMERAIVGTGQVGSPPVQEEWIPWEEVTDWYQSEPNDRHYLLDHNTGEVRFGDGNRGMIPPIGTRNVRMHTYQSGGGVVGNVSVGSVKTLVAGAKGIEKIVNLAAAAGGAEGETYESLLERAPKTLRHRDRAVAAADYEDLARLASLEVALVRCVPLLDLALDPYGIIKTAEDEKKGAGKVSLIIVPRSDEPRPLPSQLLMRQVADSVRNRMVATASLSVVGPLYVRVEIETTVRLESLRLAPNVKHDLLAKFEAFLHPLSGRGGNGWPFGRRPYESDLYSLIKTVPGVEYVNALTIRLVSDDPATTVAAIEATGRFLIYSGKHTVDFEQS